MEDDDSPENLAELEALLYSQIHHSYERDANLNASNPPEQTEVPLTCPRMLPNEEDMGPQIPQPPLAHFMQSNTSTLRSGFVPSLDIPAQDEKSRKANRKARKRHNKMVKSSILREAAVDAELFKSLQQNDRMKVIKMQKKLSYNLRRKERKKEKQAIDDYNKSVAGNESRSWTMMNQNAIIELSDSEEEAVVAIEPKIDLIVVSSEDENENVKPRILQVAKAERNCENTSDFDDSIQFVETPPQEPIVVDEESDKETTNERPSMERMEDGGGLMKPPSDESVSSSVSKISGMQQSKADLIKRRELLVTPESSNDFLDSSLTLNQSNSHNKDAQQEKQILKPQSFAESESSCSTDICSPLKVPEFNEIDFEVERNELFVEANLDSFVEYITPKRKNTANASFVEPTEENFEQVPTKATNRYENVSSTSSESEYERESTGENRQKAQKSKRKRLPSLCDFGINEIEATATNPTKQSDKNNETTHEDCENQLDDKPRKKKMKGMKHDQNKKEKKSKSDEIQQPNEIVSAGVDIAKQGSTSKSENIENKLEILNTNDQKRKSHRSRQQKNLDNVEPKKPTNCELSQSSRMSEAVETNSENVTEVVEIEAIDLIEDEEIYSVDELNGTNSDIQLVNVSTPTENNWQGETRSNATEIVDTPASWLSNDFDLENILNSLPSDPERWKILDVDRVHIYTPPKSQRCNKCREIGHTARECQRTVVKCWLCGRAGHQEPRCPNTVCTRCGRATKFYTTSCGQCSDLVNRVCKTCGNKGHTEELCPDQWRRYHLTTEVGPIKKVETNLKPPKERWCSGCGKRGHFEHACSYYNRTHVPTKPHILTYTDLYNMAPDVKSETITEWNKDPYANVTDDNADFNDSTSHYTQLDIDLSTRPDINAMLHTSKSIHILNALVNDVYCTYEFDGAHILFKGHELDLAKLRQLFRKLCNDVASNSKSIAMTHSEMQIISSERGNEFLDELRRQFDVNHRIVCTNSAQVLSLDGDAFALLLVEHRLAKFWATLIKPNDDEIIVIEDEDDVVDLDAANLSLTQIKLELQPRQFSQNAQSFKLSKFLLRMLSKTTASKEFVDHVAEENGVIWKVSNRHLVLDGPSESVANVVMRLGDFGSDNCVPCFNLIHQIDELLNRVKACSPSALDKLLMKRRYLKLNFILFGEYDLYEGKKVFADLVELVESIRDKLVMSRSVYDRAGEYMKFIRSIRHHSFYVDCVKKAMAHDTAINVISDVNEVQPYAVPDLQSSEVSQDVVPFDFELQSMHLTHLLDTAEGGSFLEELRSEVNLQVNRQESKLMLSCLLPQRDKIISKVNFYFKIMGYEFPQCASTIFNDLSKRMAKVHLDYYEVDCRHLYEEIFRDGEPEKHSGLLVKLHGLLFAKYEFLNGAEHVDTIREYMLELRHKGDALVSIVDYRRIKTAAMYMFCPFLMNLDYVQLTKLAVPPHLPPLRTLMQYDLLSAVNDVKRKLQAARERCESDDDETGQSTMYVDLVQRHVHHSNYSLDSIRVCYAFLREHFPIMFVARAANK